MIRIPVAFYLTALITTVAQAQCFTASLLTPPDGHNCPGVIQYTVDNACWGYNIEITMNGGVIYNNNISGTFQVSAGPGIAHFQPPPIFGDPQPAVDVEVPNPPCPQPTLVMDYYEPPSGPGCNDGVVEAHLIPPVACYPNHGIFELWKSGVAVASFEANSQGTTPWLVTFTGLNNDAYVVKGRPNIADCPTFGELAVAGDPCQATVTATVDFSSNDGPEGCVNNKVICSLTDPAAGTYSCVPEPTNWTANLETVPGGLPAGSGSAAYGTSITLQHVPPGNYKLVGNANTPCGHGETFVTVVGPTCQSTLTQVGAPTGGGGIWCLNSVQVEFSFTSNACYTSWAIVEANTQQLGGDLVWFAPKGENIIASVPAPQNGNNTYTFFAYPTSDPTCVASAPVSGLPTNGCDGALSSGLYAPLSAIGAEDATYWFKLTTSSCADSPWYVRLDNVQTQVVFIGVGQDESDTAFVSELPPGTYTVQYEYVGNYCHGTSGNITVPECVPTTFYADVDGDGFGDATNSVVYCLATPPSGYVGTSGDLDPQHITYPDNDGDLHGYGNTPTPGGVANNDDPDDNNATIFPGAMEYCDSWDNNWDGLVDAALPPGLVFWFPFNGDAKDVSPNALTGNVDGATLTTDRFLNPAGAYAFNGSSSRIDIPFSSVMSQSSYTIGAWVKMNGTTGAPFQTFLSKALGSGFFNSYTMSYGTSMNTVGTWMCGGSCSNVYAQVPMPIGWRMITATFDNGTHELKVYIDAVLRASLISSEPPAFDGSPFTVGFEFENGVPSYFANADIDEVMMFDRALTNGEVASVYHVTGSPYVSYVQRYALDADQDQYYSGPILFGCTIPSGYALANNLQPGDCDDASAGVNPAAQEVVCNGIDENCDGMDVPGPVANGRSLAFDGNGDRVFVPNAAGIQPTGSMTIECWARSNGPTWSDYGCMVNKRGSYILHPRQGTKTMNFYFDPTGTTGFANEYTPGASFDLTQWHHYAATYNASTGLALLYIDGEKVAEAPSPGGPLATIGDLYIGHDPCCGRYLSGGVDEVRLWNMERSACEIRTAMNSRVSPNVPGLMAYYDFNETGATPGGNNAGITTLVDRAPAFGTNNGTLQNLTLTGTVSNWMDEHGTMPLTWYQDADGDGYGSTATAITNAYQPCGYSCISGGDCNDASAAVNPTATEVCDGLDNNCNGLVDRIPMSGTKLYLPFTGNADDGSGNTHNGTVFSATLTSGHTGAANTAYQFGTGNARVEIPDHPDFRPASFTLSGWIYYGSVPGSISVLFGKPLNDGWADSYGVWFQDGLLRVGWASSPTGMQSNAYAPPAAGQWHQVVLTFDDPADVARVYIDNVLAGTYPSTFSIAYNAGPFVVGMDYENNVLAFPFNGKVDEVVLFDRVLTASEVSTLYTSAPVTMLDIICYTDNDGDGFGDQSTLQHVCVQPPGTALVAGDCDDAHATVHPGAPEICDGLDNDCNGIGDVFDQALEFDGVNDYVSLPAGMNGGAWTQLTIEAWVNIDASTGNFQTVCAPSTETFAHMQLLEGSSVAVYTNIGQIPAPVAFPTPGQWHHVALTSRSGETRFYLDGVPVGNAVTTAFSYITAPSSLSLGRGYANGRFFNGRMRDVRIWRVARTAAEIASGMSEVIPPQADLVASYRCNQGVPNGNNAGVISLVDAAGNGNTGTLNNFALTGTASNWVSGPGPAEVCNGLDDDCDGLVDEGLSCAVQVSARVILEGPYNSGTGLMNDALRSLGTFPLTDPYPGLGYTHTGSGNGGSVAPAVVAAGGNNAIVDWVLLELRSPAAPASIIASRSVLVQRDGDIVDLDGSSPVSFTVAANSYHVAVRQRNHLGCMTASPVALSSTTTAVDFTTNATTTYGTAARKSVAGTFPAEALWAGDVTFNGVVKYTGSGNDRDPMLVTVGSSTPNNVVSDTYSTRDVNLNGQVKYTGSANDRDPILVNVGSTTPNNIRVQQLP